MVESTSKRGALAHFKPPNESRRFRLFNRSGSGIRRNRKGCGSVDPGGRCAPRPIGCRLDQIGPARPQALFIMEGTETVSTDHTSGSPSEIADDLAETSPCTTPVIRTDGVEPPGLDGGTAVSSEQNQDSASLNDVDSPSSVLNGKSNPSIDGVTSIEQLVRSLESPGIGYIDEIVGRTSTDTEALEFRVTRPGTPVRRLRLTGNRYTFGSAEGCSIRLNDPALRPMHAVLLRDLSRVVVRAYSIPIQVNGTRTTEATLQVGDLLRLGAYQFELLSVSKPSNGSVLESRVEGTRRDNSDVSKSASRIPNRSNSRPSPSDLSGSEDVIWRDRLRREIDQWRDRQMECDRRESRIDDREAELRNRETELWSRAENLYRRESRLQSQEAASFQLYDDFSQRQQELIELRDQVRSRDESFHHQELEFRQQELEYRRQLDEATRQLHQSQQQAETATQAVQKMREQFEALNGQIEGLSGQHLEIESREERQRAEHERLRTELEAARNQAIDSQAESEARRQEAEARVEAMAAQIADLKSEQEKDDATNLSRLGESEDLAAQLQEKVEELQQSVSEAREESSRLRADYEEACASVRHLETLVSESHDRGDEERESWASEADELRLAVDQLSSDLAQATRELSDLRESNDDLRSRLSEVQLERDQVREDMQSRPSTEDFETLRFQLSEANEQLVQMKRDYDETLTQLQIAEREKNETKQNHETTLANSSNAIAEVSDALPDSDIQPAEIESVDAAGSVSVSDQDDDAWPTYEASDAATDSTIQVLPDDQSLQSESDRESRLLTEEPREPSDEDSTLIADSVWGELGRATELDDDAESSSSSQSGDVSEFESDPQAIGAEDAIEDGSEADALRDQDSIWPNESIMEGQTPREVAESGIWSLQEESSCIADEEMESPRADDDSGESLDPSHVPGGVTLEDELRVDEVSVDGDAFIDGSLSNMLIKNLEAESDVLSLEHARVEGFPGETTQETDYANHSNGSDSDPAQISDAADGDDLEGEQSADASSCASDLTHTDPSDDSTPDSKDVFATPGSEIDNTSLEDATEAELEEAPVSDSYNDSSNSIVDEEDTIEAYMNRLLRRVQGDPVPEPVKTGSTRGANSHLDSESLTESSEPDVADQDITPFDRDAPLVPRSTAPERGTDMNAMRELANASARIAITRSERMQTRDTQLKGMFSFVCALGAVLCGAACYHFLPGVIRYLAVAMTGVVAMIYVREGLALLQESSRQMQAIDAGHTNFMDEDEEDGADDILASRLDKLSEYSNSRK